jgi:hypothetical protein
MSIHTEQKYTKTTAETAGAHFSQNCERRPKKNRKNETKSPNSQPAAAKLL